MQIECPEYIHTPAITVEVEFLGGVVDCIYGNGPYFACLLCNLLCVANK